MGNKFRFIGVNIRQSAEKKKGTGPFSIALRKRQTKKTLRSSEALFGAENETRTRNPETSPNTSITVNQNVTGDKYHLVCRKVKQKNKRTLHKNKVLSCEHQIDLAHKENYFAFFIQFAQSFSGSRLLKVSAMLFSGLFLLGLK